MTAYEQAKADYERMLFRDSVLIAAVSFCFGALVTVVAMAVL